MRERHLSFLMLGGLIVLSVVATFAAHTLAGLDGSIAQMATRRLQQEDEMQTLEEIVQTQSGRTVTVRTTRQEGETPDAFVARHDAAVQAVKQL